MKIKSSVLLSCIATFAILPATLPASPLVSIGDNTDVFFNGSSSLRWTSNIFRDETDEVDDFIFTVSPGFEVNVGRGLSNADLSIITRYDIKRYDDRSDLDSELFHIKAIGSYKSSRLDLNGQVSFDESKTTSGDANIVGDLIESERTSAKLHGEYRLSPKFSFGAGANYSMKEYVSHKGRFADSDSITLPFNVFYELTPKVDLSAGYEFKTTSVDDRLFLDAFGTGTLRKGYDRDSHYVNVGLRGNLLPKLTGYFNVGYRIRESSDSTRQPYLAFAPVPGAATTNKRGSSGTIGMNGDLTWAATPKVTARLGFSRNFGVAGDGNSTTNSNVNLSASYSINPYWSTSGNLGYTLQEYQNDSNREDNYYTAGVRLSYTPSQHWRFSTGYTYGENDSDATSASYETNTIDLTATLRY